MWVGGVEAEVSLVVEEQGMTRGRNPWQMWWAAQAAREQGLGDDLADE